MNDMLARVRIHVDCVGRPAEVEVEAVIRTGEHELDLVLYHAMSVAVRHFADEVNVDQERIVEAPTTSLDEAARQMARQARDDELARDEPVST